MVNPRTPRDPAEDAGPGEETPEQLSPYQRHARQRPRDPVTGIFLPDPVDENAQAAMVPPRGMPNPRITRSPPPPSNPGDLREMQDRERIDPAELAMRQNRARHLEAIEDNPFIGTFEDSGFPRVPENDPHWSYLWMRATLPPTPGERAVLDTSNIADKINGGLRYEYVRLEDLPPEWQQRFSLHRGKVEGIDGAGLLVFKSMVLARTSRWLRDKKQEANDYYARLQREEIYKEQSGQAAADGYLMRQHQMNRREERFLSPDDQKAARTAFDEGVSDQVGSPHGGKGF
jgi:hypothetical protein